MLVLLLFLAPMPVAAESCPPPGLSIDRPILTREACAAWRYVGFRAEGRETCPEPAPVPGVVWSVRPLFEAPPSGGPVPAALRPFCVYLAEGASGPELDAVRDALGDLVDGGHLSGATASCAALFPAAERGDAWRQARTRWREHFLVHAEALRGAYGEPTFDPAPEAVRLAVLDTQPVAEDGFLVEQTNSDHGRSLIELAETLVCRPDADGIRRCAADVQPQLALHIAAFDWDDEEKTVFDMTMGGFYGTIDRLAEAVWAEVREQREQKLILNLSVAWVGERFGGLEETAEQMPEPVRALYQALRVASCEGALVVAAAGNRLGGPEKENGALLPAGWERRAAPDAAACEALKSGEPLAEESRRSRVAGSPARPLVYAVSGISGDGAKLSNARPGSEPARVAYADHAVTEDTAKVLTGSSVSAIVVSAAAAVAWSHDLERGAHELMALVEGAGRDLGRRAELHSTSGHVSAPMVRRLGVCTGLAAVLSARGGGDFTCEAPPGLLPRYPSLECDGEVIEFSSLVGSRPVDAFCGIRSISYDPEAGEPGDPCPYRQFFGIQTRPWSGPQPQENPCSGCDIQPPPSDYGGDDPTGVLNLRIAIDPQWPGGTLGPVIFAAGDHGFALDLELEAGECALLEHVDAALIRRRAGGHRPPVRLHFMTADGASIESPVLIGGFPQGEDR